MLVKKFNIKDQMIRIITGNLIYSIIWGTIFSYLIPSLFETNDIRKHFGFSLLNGFCSGTCARVTCADNGIYL